MDDLISRQAAIEAMMDLFKRVPTNAIRAKDKLEELPSVQQKNLCSDCQEFDCYGCQYKSNNQGNTIYDY